MAEDYNIDYLCKCVGIPYHQLKMKNRNQRYVFARYIIIDYLISKGLTQKEAGAVFNLTHATAYNGWQQLRNALRFNSPKFVHTMHQAFYAELAEEQFCPFIQTKELESCLS